MRLVDYDTNDIFRGTSRAQQVIDAHLDLVSIKNIHDVLGV